MYKLALSSQLFLIWSFSISTHFFSLTNSSTHKAQSPPLPVTCSFLFTVQQPAAVPRPGKWVGGDQLELHSFSNWTQGSSFCHQPRHSLSFPGEATPFRKRNLEGKGVIHTHLLPYLTEVWHMPGYSLLQWLGSVIPLISQLPTPPPSFICF